MKQKRDRYEMHKYWGKKPSSDLGVLIRKYSKEGDTVLDPFSGYGVFCCEAFLLNRNIISNDLNPIANFLNKQLLNKAVDLELLKQQWDIIRAEFKPFVEKWFKWKVDNKTVQLSSVLRDKNDIPLKAKYKVSGNRKALEIELTDDDVNKYIEYESSQVIDDWYPVTSLIVNSRISAKKGMNVSDVFTKRTLSCHAKLLSLIEKHSFGKEQDLFKVAFTANLANCSRLVPPIKSRGDMAPGAWMTGFYTGETYLENNVLQYFENRLVKVIKGKSDYLSYFDKSDELDLNLIKYNNEFRVIKQDAKKLDIESESIDYIFTDPPYGDAVPYFEQSIIWNSWLNFVPDYDDEIVITDSKERKKNNTVYEQDINKAFAEIRRVLKTGKMFSLTYHSLSGLEWKAITNACIKNGFDLVDFEWLVQKSFTPRQINRARTIKGDVLVTFKKSKIIKKYRSDSREVMISLFSKTIAQWLEDEVLDTNEIFLRIMKIVFSERIVIGDIDLLKILVQQFIFTKDNKWALHDEFNVC
ncbi:hypothetical protein A9Q74_13760 [Colwellia sp. 39_35_sub15_T18]|nr:hypothetical protein A9Q74_13760 [Colwellia sp. 39_35_sub15_T18]